MKQTKTLEINNKEFKAVLQDGEFVVLSVPKVQLDQTGLDELLAWLLDEVQSDRFPTKAGSITVEPYFKDGKIPPVSSNKELAGRTSVSSSDYGAGLPDLKIQDMSDKIVNPVKINVPVTSRPKGT